MSLLSQVSIHSFIQENGIKTETGKPLDFTTHRYLFDIYRDNSKYLCCLKAGQIGFSTMAILKTLWLSKNRGIDIGYILPTVEMVQKFVGSKVNRMVQQNPVLSAWTKDKDSITQKQIGENYVHYLGAQTERSAIMISLDMLVADEYNKAPQDILEVYDSRLQHSQFGYKWVFSNPTIPDFGVDRFWNISDQKKWHITHSCGENYIMDESCVDYQTRAYRCPKCHGEITDEERRMGEWKATAVGEWSGYWIPLWINPMIPASTICDHKETKTAEYFYNFVAGLSYVNPNDALSLPALLKNLSSDTNARTGRTIIGLDTGHNLHYTLMNSEGAFYYGYCPSIAEAPEKGSNYDPYDEIEKLLITDSSAILIADQGGDLIGVRKLQAKFPGRVYLVWFTKETRSQQIIRYGENDEQGKVLVDRNRAVQLAVDQLNEARMTFNGTEEDWHDFFQHCLNIYRVKEIIDENEPTYGWKWVWKRKGPDHWFMSFIYALVGLDRFGGEKAQIIKKDRFLEGVKTASNVDGTIRGSRYLSKIGYKVNL